MEKARKDREPDAGGTDHHPFHEPECRPHDAVHAGIGPASPPTISTYASSMHELQELSEEIDRCILDNRVDDRASAELGRVRKKIAILTERVRQKLDAIMSAPGTRDLLQDSVVSMRGNHYVVPVKREHRQKLDGQVLDISSSGSTVFIEPAAIRTLKSELDLLHLDEEQEVYRILSTLTNMAERSVRELRVNLETMAQYDFLFARAKLANGMRAILPELSKNGRSVIVRGRHPLIEGDVIPLDFHIGDDFRALVITGPNTGGKTVVLKTVGLFSLMAQAGLHVPAEAGTCLAVNDDILADIGDGQSITQSLSTFSSHIRNIICDPGCRGATHPHHCRRTRHRNGPGRRHGARGRGHGSLIQKGFHPAGHYALQ